MNKFLTFWCLLVIYIPLSHATQLQHTDTVLMISPDNFKYNVETAKTNSFQHESNLPNIKKIALAEFQEMLTKLKENDIRVIAIPSTKAAMAVFPNNWFSVHSIKSGEVTLVIYPMLVKSRREERQVQAIKHVLYKNGIRVSKIIDLSSYEKKNMALEGTGSLVLDRVHNWAFASISPRTNTAVLNEFSKKLNYNFTNFHSYSVEGMPIYHTNVMLSIGTKFAVIAAERITDASERKKVIAKLESLGKKIIYISSDQMTHMAANILEVESRSGQTKIILSRTAFHAFTEEQRQQLARYGELVVVNIDTIERVGGGSARCMLAEIFYT